MIDPPALAELWTPMLFNFLDGSFQVSGTVFGFTFWTVVLPILGNSNL